MEERQEKTLRIFGFVVAIVIALIVGYNVGYDRAKTEWYKNGYLSCKGSIENAVENYPADLRKKVMDDFKEQEQNQADLYYDITHNN